MKCRRCGVSLAGERCPRCNWATSDPPVCDFCSSPAIKWEYRCEDYVTSTPEFGFDSGSRGSWAACDECKSIIERDDKETLAKRSVATWPGGLPRAQRREVLPLLRRYHKGFWSLKVGPPVPITEDRRLRA